MKKRKRRTNVRGNAASEKKVLKGVKEATSGKEVEGSETQPVFRRKDILVSAFIFVFSQVVYLLTLAPSVFFGDSGELTAAAYNLGIAHPPGYPLYLLIGKLAISVLWIGDPAYRMNLLSALFASSTAILLYLTMRCISTSRPVAALTALVAAFSSALWCQAVVAEVYTLAALFFCLLVFFTVYWMKTADKRVLPFLALTSGLALTHHLSVLSFYPIIAVFVLRRSSAFLNDRRFLLKSVLLLLAPLLLYLYLPIRSAADPVNDWGNPETFSAMKDHIFAKLYRVKLLQFGFGGVIIQMKKLLAIIPQQFTPWLLALAAAGLVAGLKKESTLFWLFLTLLVVNVFVSSLYYIYDIESYFIPSFLMMSVFIGYALETAYRFARRLKKKPLEWAVLFLLAIVALVPLVSNWTQCDRSKNNLARNFGMNMLNSLEPDSILICRGDNALYIVAYLKIVEGMRPDVTVYGELQNIFAFPIFRKVRDIAQISQTTIGAYERQLVFTSPKPVYMSFKPDDTFPHVDYGILYRILRRGEPPDRIGNPWPRYNLEGIEDPDLLDDNMSREIVGEYLVAQAMYHWKRGDSKKGKERIDKAVQVANTHPAVLSLAADFLVQVKQWDRAETLFNRILELNPYLSICHIRLGIISIFKEDYRLAIERLNQGLKQKSDAFLGTINRGIAFERLGDSEASPSEKERLYRNALRDYTLSNRMDPSHPFANAGISRVSSKLYAKDED